MILPVPSTPAIAAGPNAPQPPSEAPAASVDSKFSELVQQMVDDSASAAGVRLPVKGSAPAAEALPDLPAAALPTPVKEPDDKVPTIAPSVPRRPDARQAAHPATSSAQAPALPVDQPVLQILLPPKPQLPAAGNGGANELKPFAVSAHDTPPRIALEPKPMLEVKIHLDPSAMPVTPHASGQPAVKDAAPAPSGGSPAVQPASPQDTESSLSQQNPQNQHRGTSESAPQQPAPPRVTDADHAVAATSIKEEVAVAPHQSVSAAPAPTPVQAANAASAPAPVVEPAPAAPLNTPRHQPSAPSAPLQAAPVPDPPKAQQPIRSMALEFTPDGANDIKVRLSERGGDVHISLHGTDPALAGRVREGVSDLVGSLSKAGYDAEAWTPSQGRQHQGREQEPRQHAQQPKTDSDSGEFGSIFQQPTQEIS